MGKLHQLLAVEPDKEGKYKRVCDESKKVFGKAAMFTGSHRTLHMFEDGVDATDPDTHQSMTTTVRERMGYTGESISDYFDALYQKEATNQKAKADLVVDGTVIAKEVPATFLLALESRLKYVRGVYETMPTLQAGIEWVPSDTMGAGIWEMKHPEEKLKTKMTVQHEVLVPPTKEHRAEIEKWEEQIPIGKFVKRVWCSMLTSPEKQEILARIDKLIQATKQARQKANAEEVVGGNVGRSIIDFINNGPAGE